MCIVGDAAAVSAAGSDAADDPDEDGDAASRDSEDAATYSGIDGGNLDGGEAPDGTMSTPSDGASPQDSASNAEAGPSGDAATGCASSPCQHGGTCNGSGSQYSCDCASTGSEGANCESDIDECAGGNVCSGMSADGVAFSFACVNEAPHYRCQGLFPDWPLQDPPNRFSQGFRVVDDAKTGLQWEHPVSSQMHSWETARDYCGGKAAGWRVPTKAELESIVDDTRSEPSIDTNAFAETPAMVYWTSAILAGIPANGNPGAQFAWGVSFRDGTVFPVQYTGGAAVRCVRLRP